MSAPGEPTPSLDGAISTSSFFARLREPLPLALAVLAGIGWVGLVAIWIWSSVGQNDLNVRFTELEAERSSLATQFAARDDAKTSLEAIAGEVAAATASLEQMRAEEDKVSGQLAQSQELLQQAQDALSSLTNQSNTVRVELDAANQSLSDARTQLAEAETSLTTRTAELTAVGARLEAARSDEAATRATIAQLSQEASAGSAQVAEIEQRLQAVREAEADAQLKIDEVRRAESALADSRAGLEAAIAGLESRRATLTEEISRGEEQRQSVQAQVTALTDTLAKRGTDLASLEKQIETAQAQSSISINALAVEFSIGDYLGTKGSGDPLRAVFSADGIYTLKRIRLNRMDGPADVNGRYSAAGDQLILHDATGNLGTATFPMSCTIALEPAGFFVPVQAEGCLLQGFSFAVNSSQ